MDFRIIDAHAYALIQCACGEYMSLSSEYTETCPACSTRYKLATQVCEVVVVTPKEIVVEQEA